MLSKKTKASVGVETARALIEDPKIRQAAAHAAAGTSRVGFGVTKRIARRRTRRRLERYRDVAQTAVPALATHGPLAAQSLGLVERPSPAKHSKPRGRPALAAGLLIGASTMYFLAPGAGRGHREQLARVVARIRS